MRILSKRQLKELVLYSPQHIARLEKAGLFPKRVSAYPVPSMPNSLSLEGTNAPPVGMGRTVSRNVER